MTGFTATLHLAIITVFIATTSAFVLAQTTPTPPSASDPSPLFPASTSIHYHAFVGNSACGYPMYNNTLEAERCTHVLELPISIARTPANDCSFTLFIASKWCGAGEGGEKVVYQIPAGEGEVCLNTDWPKDDVSGVWSCR